MNVTRRELAPGICLTAIQTDKFKSATLSATFLTPMDKKTAAVNAIVPYLLRRGCEAYPTMREITSALDELYGGVLDAAVRKRGETQGLGIIGSFLDEPYVLDSEPVLEPAVGLLTQMLLHPVTENGIFKAEYVAGEKENLIQAIRAQINEKRQYAILRLTQEMCKEETYGVPRLGEEEDVAAITPQSAWEAYQDLLATAQVELHYCGSAPIERVMDALRELVEGLKTHRGELVELDCEVRKNAVSDTPQVVTDHLDVTQGKLALGFRTGGSCIWENNYPALLVLNALYGGTATSKLFLNVREKLSLCYYASSMLESLKGLVVVSSGVEFDKLEEAQGEILAQLEAVKAGNFTDEELESAKQAVINSYKSALDSRSQLELHYLTAAITDVRTTPEELVEQVKTVTAEQVSQVAQGLELDTVYRLMGKEEHHG